MVMLSHIKYTWCKVSFCDPVVFCYFKNMMAPEPRARKPSSHHSRFARISADSPFAAVNQWLSKYVILLVLLTTVERNFALHKTNKQTNKQKQQLIWWLIIQIFHCSFFILFIHLFIYLFFLFVFRCRWSDAADLNSSSNSTSHNIRTSLHLKCVTPIVPYIYTFSYFLVAVDDVMPSG